MCNQRGTEGTGDRREMRERQRVEAEIRSKGEDNNDIVRDFVSFTPAVLQETQKQ